MLVLSDTTNPQELYKRLGRLEEQRSRWVEHSVLTQCEKFVGRKQAIFFDVGWEDGFLG